MTGWGGLPEGSKWSVLEKYIATAGAGDTLRAPVPGSTCTLGKWGKWVKRGANEASGASGAGQLGQVGRVGRLAADR